MPEEVVPPEYTWSDEEATLLREGFPRQSWDYLLSVLPARTKNAIDGKGRRLGLKRPPPANLWTNEEVNLLRKHYGKLSWDGLLQLLPKRTKKGIKAKASELGISSTASELPAPLMLSRVDASYIAGILDGDGAIQITKHTHSTRTGRRVKGRRWSLDLHVRVCNGNWAVVDWIKSLTKMGGINTRHPNLEQGVIHKNYTFELGSKKDVYRFLSAIVPFLRVKRKRADLMLEFVKSRIKRGDKRYTERELEIAENLIKEVKKIG